MGKFKTNRADDNQKEIAEKLEKRGYSVALSHDDILVGANGRTYWYEIKTGPKANIRPNQINLLDNWKGHYRIVWSAEMIIAEIEKDERD